MFEWRGCYSRSVESRLPPSLHLFDTAHTRRLKLCKTPFCQIHLPPRIRPRVLREEDAVCATTGERGVREEGEGRIPGILRFLRLCTGIYNSYVYLLSNQESVGYLSAMTTSPFFNLLSIRMYNWRMIEFYR